MPGPGAREAWLANSHPGHLSLPGLPSLARVSAALPVDCCPRSLPRSGPGPGRSRQDLGQPSSPSRQVQSWLQAFLTGLDRLGASGQGSEELSSQHPAPAVSSCRCRTDACSFFFFLFEDLFNCLKEVQRRRDTERVFFHLLFTLQGATTAIAGPGCSEEPGASLGSSMGVGVEVLGPSSSALPGALAGSWIQSGAAGPGTGAHRRGRHCRRRLAHCATAPALRLLACSSLIYVHTLEGRLGAGAGRLHLLVHSRNEPGQSQEPGALSTWPVWVPGAPAPEPTSALPRVRSKELYQEQSSQAWDAGAASRG